MFSISISTVTSSLTGIRITESCDSNLGMPVFVLQCIQIDLAGEAGLRIDKSTWVWQLRGQTDAWYRETSYMCVCIYIYFFSHSSTAVSLPLNQFTANKKFIMLFKIGFFFTSLLILGALCKSLQEQEDGERRRKRKKKGADIRKWDKEK